MMGGAGSSQPIVIQTAPIQAQIAQPAQVYSCYCKSRTILNIIFENFLLHFPKILLRMTNCFFQTGQTIQLQGGQQVGFQHHIHNGKAITVKVIFYAFIGRRIRKLVLYGSGVHPAAGLTPPSSFQLFHRRRIECTNIENNKQKIEKRIFFRINPRRHYKGSRKCWK